MDIVKLEFIASDASPAAYFLVSQEIKDAFIAFLKTKNVSVGAPIEYLTVSGVEHFQVEIQSKIPPQDGNSLVSEFLATKSN